MECVSLLKSEFLLKLPCPDAFSFWPGTKEAMSLECDDTAYSKKRRKAPITI